ncbi:MAG: hypothetical protein Q4P15_06120 [Propionibacteriaceae bacterium]|nr:hypothetical protein [Propionibacteriaceae bacterium]
MSGEISESAKMTLQGNTDGEDGVGMNDGVPPAEDAAQVADGQPREYPADIDTDADRRGNGQT